MLDLPVHTSLNLQVLLLEMFGEMSGGNASFSAEDTKAGFDFGSVGNASINLNGGNYFLVFKDQGYAPTAASIINVGDSYTAITSTTEAPGRPSVNWQ